MLAFGTERDGLSDDLLARADLRLALPMMPGVSRLNLATAVSGTLFALDRRPPKPAPNGCRPFRCGLEVTGGAATSALRAGYVA